MEEEGGVRIGEGEENRKGRGKEREKKPSNFLNMVALNASPVNSTIRLKKMRREPRLFLVRTMALSSTNLLLEKGGRKGDEKGGT